MPIYKNPNPHGVYISLAHPNTVLMIYPAAWPLARVPRGGKQEVVLDEVIARPMVKLGQLVEVAEKRILIVPADAAPPADVGPVSTEQQPAPGPPEPVAASRETLPAPQLLLKEMSEDAQLERFKKAAKARSDNLPCERASTDPRGSDVSPPAVTVGTATLNPEMAAPAQLPQPANPQDEVAKPKKRFSL